MKQDRVRGERDRNYGSAEVEETRAWPDHGHGHYDYYAKSEGQDDYDRYREPERDNDGYDRMDEDGYDYHRAASEPRDKDDRRSKRSDSREYDEY